MIGLATAMVPAVTTNALVKIREARTNLKIYSTITSLIALYFVSVDSIWGRSIELMVAKRLGKISDRARHRVKKTAEGRYIFRPKLSLTISSRFYKPVE